MLKLETKTMTAAIAKAKTVGPKVRVISADARTYAVYGSRGDALNPALRRGERPQARRMRLTGSRRVLPLGRRRQRRYRGSINEAGGQISRPLPRKETRPMADNNANMTPLESKRSKN